MVASQMTPLPAGAQADTPPPTHVLTHSHKFLELAKYCCPREFFIEKWQPARREGWISCKRPGYQTSLRPFHKHFLTGPLVRDTVPGPEEVS